MAGHTLDLARIAPFGDPATEEGRAALVEILRVYFDNVESSCLDMRAATTADEVKRHAHRAKGASAMVGALSMAELFADLEARAAAGETIAGETFEDIQRQLAAMRRQVAAQLESNLL